MSLTYGLFAFGVVFLAFCTAILLNQSTKRRYQKLQSQQAFGDHFANEYYESAMLYCPPASDSEDEHVVQKM